MEHGSILNGNIRPRRVSSQWQSTAYRSYIERAEHHPASFLVLGDALMSTNPIYGLGISSAAIEARELRNAVKECLSASNTTLIVPKYYAAVRRTADLAWKVSSWSDKCYPRVEDWLSTALKILAPVRSTAMTYPTFCRQLYGAVALSTAKSFERTLLNMALTALKSWACRFARSIWSETGKVADIASAETAPRPTITDGDPS